MADDATALTPPAVPADPGALSAGQWGAVQASIKKQSEKINAAAENLPNRIASIHADTDAKLGALDAERAALKPPELQEVPLQHTQQTNPVKAWGSMAMLAAVFGSLFTRRSFTTALNAASGVLTAYRQGDQAAANQAFATWKVSNENALRMFNYQNATYRAALQDITRREGQVTTSDFRQEADAIAEVKAQAYAFNDGMMAEVKSLADAERIALLRESLSLRMAEAGPKLEETHSYMSALHELQSHPDYQSADPIKRRMMERQLLKSTAPQLYNVSKNAMEASFKAQLGVLTSERVALNDKMKAYATAHGGIIPDKDANYARMSAQRDAVDQSITAMHKANAEQLADLSIDLGDEDPPAGGGLYKTAGDVAAAYRAGTINRATAERIIEEHPEWTAR